MRTTLVLTLLSVLLWGAGTHAPEGASITSASAQAPPAAPPGERTVWYFYTVRWGAQDEFLDLFQKNHYPVLRSQLKSRLTSIKAYVPTYHGDGRADWTFAVALTYRDTATMTGPSPEPEIARKMFPIRTSSARKSTRHFGLPMGSGTFRSARSISRRATPVGR